VRVKVSQSYASRPAVWQERLGIAPWRRTLGDEPTEALAIVSEEPVERVHQRRDSERAKHAAERSRQLDLRQERHAATTVTRDRCAIAENDPPTFAAPDLGNGCEQTPRFLIREGKQGQLLPSIERGDDPRRPAAEPSAAGIQQDRAPEARRRHDAGAQVLCRFRAGQLSVRSAHWDSHAALTGRRVWPPACPRRPS
jgi:hypothetical protein